MRKVLGSLVFSLTALPVLQAQETQQALVSMASEEQVSRVLNLAMATVAILLLVVLVLALSIQVLIRITLQPLGKSVSKDKGPSWWSRFAGVAPAPGKQMDREIGHVYDGIQELDNDMPPWFKYLFYVTIIFAVLYILDYHVLKLSPLQDEEYALEVEAAEIELAKVREQSEMSIDEHSVKFVSDPASLESGKTIYLQNCAVCHGQKGEGMVGPNMTDEFWINGGGIQNIFKSIKYGVPEKGMISWQNQLNPKQIQEVSAYIITLEGTNPPNPKAPQGDIWKPEPNVSTVD